MSANRVEKMVYWYFRFNGYLTVENFTVHPNFKRDPEAEADILAVRFPMSAEDPIRFKFERDHNLILSDRIDFIMSEIKSSVCDINPSWQDPGRENIQYALRWFGHFSEKEINKISEAIYKQKAWYNDIVAVRFICFGNKENQGLKDKYPDLRQILHWDTMNFVFSRLTTGCLKLHRENWDAYIQFISRRIDEGWGSEQLLAWTLAGE